MSCEEIKMSKTFYCFFIFVISLGIFEAAIVYGAPDTQERTTVTEDSKKSYLEKVAVGFFCADALTRTKPNLLGQPGEYFNETEQGMRDQGYNEDMIKGLDYVNANLRLAQVLRDRLSDTSINPHTLHIPEFAELIDTHIAFFEGIIRSQRDDDKADRLELLERLKSEAQQRKTSETMTYIYWVTLHLRLSLLATPEENRYNTDPHHFYYTPEFEDPAYLRKWIVDGNELESYYKIMQRVMNQASINDFGDQSGVLEAISKEEERLTLHERNKIGGFLYLTNKGFTDTEDEVYMFVKSLYDFPRIIMIPTIYSLGAISVNKAYGTGVIFVGLEKDNPYESFLSRVYCEICVYIDNSQVRSHFQNLLGRLKGRQREVVEAIFHNGLPNNALISLESVLRYPPPFLVPPNFVETDTDRMLEMGYKKDEIEEGTRIFVALIISSLIKEKGIEKTMLWVENYFNQLPQLQEYILREAATLLELE